MLPYINIAGIQIPTYGICMITGIAIAVLVMLRRCKKENLRWEDPIIIIFTGLGFGLIGAKLLYIFVTYSPAEIFRLIINGEMSKLFQSGLVFYGGLIFGILGAFVGARIAKARLSDYEYVIIPLLPLAHAFGRLGCLFSGCCYGRITDSFLQVVYTNPISDAPRNIPLIPIQAYEVLLNIILFLILSFLSKKLKGKTLLCVYLISYAVIRFVIEFERFDAVRGEFGIFSTSQWISIAIFLVSTYLLIREKYKKV